MGQVLTSKSSLVSVYKELLCCKWVWGRVLMKRAAVGSAEQQWNHQWPVWILEIHPFWTPVSLDGCHQWCSPLFLAWRAPAGEQQWSVRRTNPWLVLFRDDIFSPQKAFYKADFCLHQDVPSLFCTSATLWTSVDHWLFSGGSCWVYTVTRKGKGCHARGLTYCVRERNPGQLYWCTATTGHHRLCDFPDQNCWVPDIQSRCCHSCCWPAQPRNNRDICPDASYLET